MNGYINMKMEDKGHATKVAIDVDVTDVSFNDKCALVDSLFEALEVEGAERSAILLAVTLNSMEGKKNEG